MYLDWLVAFKLIVLNSIQFKQHYTLHHSHTKTKQGLSLQTNIFFIIFNCLFSDNDIITLVFTAMFDMLAYDLFFYLQLSIALTLLLGLNIEIVVKTIYRFLFSI